MAKKWRYISQDAVPATGAGGLTTANVRANIRHIISIAAAVSAVRLLIWTAGGDWTCDPSATGFDTDMDVQMGLRGYTASTANGSGWEQVPLTSYVQDQAYITPAYTVNLSPGDKLHTMVHARATSASRNVMGSRKVSSSESYETGTSSLAAKTNGETLGSAGNNGLGFAPGGILGETDTPSIMVLGHSVVGGVGVISNDVYGVVAARSAGYGCCPAGVGGSNPTSTTTSGPWDLTQLSDVVFVHWMINNINSQTDANPTMTATDYIVGTGSGGARDLTRTVVRRLKGFGKKVVICTEYFTDDTGTYGTERKAMRGYWNDYVRGTTSYGSTTMLAYTGADDYYDLAAVAENQPNLHTAKSGFTVSLHPVDAEHALIGADLATAIKPGGRLYYLFEAVAAEDAGYIPNGIPDMLWGPSLSAGTAWGDWLYWVRTGAPNGSSLNRDGTGGITAKASASYYDQCLIHNVASPALGGIIEATTADFPTENSGASPPRLGYYSVGFTPSNAVTGGSAEATSGTGRIRYGYQVTLWGTGINLFRNVGSGGARTSLWSTTHTATTSGTDRFRVKLTRSVSAGQNVIRVQVWRNGTSLHDETVTDTSPPVGWDGDLYPYIGTSGTSASEFPNAKVWDTFASYQYNPITIASVTPNLGEFELVPGDRKSFSATVLQDGGDVAVGQVVTTSLSGITSGTVGGSATTGVDGVARFVDGSGVFAPSTTTVGTTGTLTLSSGGVSGTITINIVAAYSTGGGGGSSIMGSPEVMVEDAVPYTPDDDALLTDTVKLSDQYGIYAEEAGDIVILTSAGNERTIPIPANGTIFVRAKKILATGTTATGIFVLAGRS